MNAPVFKGVKDENYDPAIHGVRVDSLPTGADVRVIGEFADLLLHRKYVMRVVRVRRKEDGHYCVDVEVWPDPKYAHEPEPSDPCGG